MLLALFAPTQLSAGAQQGWAGDLMLRANPLTAGVHYVGRVLVDGHSRDADLLVAPAVAAIALATVALLAAGRMRLRPGGARRGAGSPSRLPCCLRWRGREPPARRSR